MSEVQVFKLPDVGEGLTEAQIVTWHVQVGDRVAVNDVLVDVETAKSVVELPSPFAGDVVELHAKEGDELAVGAPLITVGALVAAHLSPPARVLVEPAPRDEPLDPPANGTRPDDAPLVLVGTGPREAGGRRVRVRLPDSKPFERPRPGEDEARPLVVPRVGTLAVDAPRQGSGDTRIPVRGVRKATAEAMVRSAFTAPHAAMWTTVDVTETMQLVRRLRADPAWSDVRVGPMVLIARAVALAVRRYPEINASWDDAAQEIVVHGALNLGIAAATPRGLMVPVVKDVGSRSVRELASAFAEVTAKARTGKLTPADMTGGTLTLTNVGTFGVEGATPILNPPEAAILALGAIQPRPWAVDGEVLVREVMTLSISIDHRLVDGELGAKVLRCVAEFLHDPARAML